MISSTLTIRRQGMALRHSIITLVNFSSGPASSQKMSIQSDQLSASRSEKSLQFYGGSFEKAFSWKYWSKIFPFRLCVELERSKTHPQGYIEHTQRKLINVFVTYTYFKE